MILSVASIQWRHNAIELPSWWVQIAATLDFHSLLIFPVASFWLFLCLEKSRKRLDLKLIRYFIKLYSHINLYRSTTIIIIKLYHILVIQKDAAYATTDQKSENINNKAHVYVYPQIWRAYGICWKQLKVMNTE